MTDSTDPTPPIKPYRLQPPVDVPEPVDTELLTPMPKPRTPGAAGGGLSANGTSLSATVNAQDRYGVRRGMSRGRKIGLAVVGLAILGGVASYIGWQQSHPAIQGTVLKFSPQTDSVAVTFEIDKASASTATCTLQALNTQGAVIGSVAVQVPAGRSTNVMSYTLSTTSEANTVEVSSCEITS
jgi:uncharacterized protein DUF4307